MEVSQLKLDLAANLRRGGFGSFDLADCEVKSNWLRRRDEREKRSRFLRNLGPLALENLTNVYFQQLAKREAVVIASVIDKRLLRPGTTLEVLHQKAYEFLLERVQNYMSSDHRCQQALIIMDDMDKELNRAVAMRHASYLRTGNWNTDFQNIVEYPFFTRSELSNGVQLADQLAYNVYHAFRYEDMNILILRGWHLIFTKTETVQSRMASKSGQTIPPLLKWSKQYGHKKSPSLRKNFAVGLGEPFEAHQEHPTYLRYMMMTWGSTLVANLRI